MSNKVISFHYILKNSQGEIIDESTSMGPMNFVSGQGQIIPGLEERLLAMAIGDKDTVNVSAADAYGERDEKLVVEAEKKQFPEDIEVGQQFSTDPQGGSIITVTEISGETVTVDANHPLAGENLEFAVEIVETRDATEEDTQPQGGCCGGSGDGGCGCN